MLNFNEFMNKVDEIIISKIGLTSADLDDYNWYDEYECGSTPEEAVENFADYFEIEALW